ncbi:hypothetical protein BT69DRAFT_1277606 [Atractiella rhizophila]|nr:hypothetical protein BT69DRAFT_1277606 [Atractiella rhizophila]
MSHHLQFLANSPPQNTSDLSLLGPFHAGSTWVGTQTNGRKSYGVRVTILSVDTAHSKLDGYLSIRGLTRDIEELTTYFEGEILGLPTGDGLHETDSLNQTHDRGVGFLTPDWATEAEDLKHWSRFPPFLPLKQSAASSQSVLPEKYKYDPDKPNGKHVFMRWKEKFVVPDHTVTDIRGASYEGFYYVCVSFERPSLPPQSKPSKKPSRLQKSVSSSTIPTSPSLARSASMSPTRPTVRLPQTSVLARSTSPATGANATPITFSSPPRPAFSYAAAVRRNSTSAPSDARPSFQRTRAQSTSSTMTRPIFPYPTPPREPVPLPDVGINVIPDTIIEDADEQAQKSEDHSEVSSPAQAPQTFSFSDGDFPGMPSPTSPSASLPALTPSPRRCDNISPERTKEKVEKPITYPADPFCEDDEEEFTMQAHTSAWKYATMNGFYYHANSEPFQEIKLSYADFWSGSRGSIVVA